MKNYCLLAVVVAMLLHACQKENSVIPLQETESKSPIVVTHISGEEIPEIMHFLGSKQNITTKSSLVSTPLGEVEIENILHTLDTLGNKNYSFLVLPETDNPNSIFNLVVSFSEEDTSPDMAILEYRMTEEFSHAYYSGEKDFAEFTGNLYKYPFTPETYADLLSKDTCVQNFDEIVICDEAIFTNGGAGGGSGTGSGLDYNPIGDGDDGDGSSSSGSGAVVTAGWLCNHFGAMHENPAQCTNPGAGGTWIITFITVPDDHTDKGIVSVGKELNCCDDAYIEGNVATNLTTEALSDIMDCMGILSEDQFNGLKRWPRKTIALKNFLVAEQCSAEAKTFGKHAIDGIIEGGIVDYEDKIINAIDNPCAANVVDTANLMDNELANDMKDAFGSNYSNFDVVYLQTDLDDENDMKTLGLTDPYLDENGNIEIINIWLDSDFLDAGTDVAIFSTVIHENMHALMYYQLDSMGITPDDVNLDLSILADQWSQVVAESSGGPLPPNDLAYTQHEIMSDLVDTMAELIINFASNNNYSIDQTQAEALAWLGLDDSVAWTVMDQNLKDTYDAIIDYEVTSFEILSVGANCN